MLRLAKAFLDIALGRQTPAHLPASVLLLVLAAIAVALTEVFGALLPPPPNGQIALRIVLEVGLPLLFAWLLLALTRRRERFLQTATALLGVAAIAAVILYPLDSVLRFMGQESVAALLVGVLYTAIFIGYLLACAHIWRSALDSGFVLGALISFSYFILSAIIGRQVLLQS
jgi:hypothetical protein